MSNNKYIKYNQLISSPTEGDCFRACMATLLQVPIEVLTNYPSDNFYSSWCNFLCNYGLTIYTLHATDAIWRDEFWIATVPSLNYENTTHSIVMYKNYIIFHDPSTKIKYKAGTSLLEKGIIHSGTHLAILNITRIHLLDELRKVNQGDIK